MSSRARQENERAALMATLRRAGREQSDATVLFHATIAEQMGINATDEKTMSILERVGPLTAGELARRTGLATASVTDLIDRLERKGFVRRIRDPEDRRRVIVEADPERVRQMAPLFESGKRSLMELFEPYSNDQLAVILDFMTRNAERLRAETAKIAAEPAKRTPAPRKGRRVAVNKEARYAG